MHGKRVTGRFYVFLIIVVVGLFFIIRELLPTATTEAVVTLANATYSRKVDAVIVRDETVTMADAGVRVVYVANEGQRVATGDEIADVFTAGYSEREITKLETVRENIRAYHTLILDNIVDNQLDGLEKSVQDCALQLKTLIARKSGGSLINLEKQLEESLSARQEYLRQNRREDPTLNRYYDEEQKRESAVSSWRTVESAGRDGIVSFYLDGCETFLTPSNLSLVTIEDVRQILQGRVPQAEVSSRLKQSIFRVVGQDAWYLIMLSSETDWNPVTGTQFSFQIEGYVDEIYTGTVTQMQKTDNQVMAVLRIEGSVGNLINKRYGKAIVGVNMTGLSVPLKAVTSVNGQSGVVVNDAAGGSFVPVTILSTDSRYALVQPVTEGTLTVGQRVLVQ